MQTRCGSLLRYSRFHSTAHAETPEPTRRGEQIHFPPWHSFRSHKVNSFFLSGSVWMQSRTILLIPGYKNAIHLFFFLLTIYLTINVLQCQVEKLFIPISFFKLPYNQFSHKKLPQCFGAVCFFVILCRVCTII